MTETAFFHASGFDNEIPSAADRVGSTFWGFMAGQLGLPQHRPGKFSPGVNVVSLVTDAGDGVSPAIAAIRAYEARRLPKAPVGVVVAVGEAVGDAVADVVEAVRDAVRKVTKIDAAKAWLLETLRPGPMEAVAIEAQGKKAGHTLKNLKIAKERLSGISLRRSGRWFWSLPKVAKKSRGGIGTLSRGSPGFRAREPAGVPAGRREDGPEC